MRTSKGVTVPAVVVLLAAGMLVAGSSTASEHPTSEQKASGPLDGKVFKGVIGKAGETQGDADELVFKDGTFTSSACEQLGFHAAAYQAKAADDGTISFTVTATNDADETMSWSGLVDHGKVEATAVHETGSERTEYWYKGKLKAKKKEHPDHPKAPEHPTGDHPH